MKKTKIELVSSGISEIDINLPKLTKKQVKKQKQRTDKWRKDRLGRWTGSQLKSLMTCGLGKSRLPWDNLDRLFSLGTSVLKYIYENAMERKTNRYIEKGSGTVAMRYGTVIEPIIFKEVKRLLKKQGVKGKLKEVGFKKFNNVPNAGVSSDGALFIGGKPTIPVEIKACTNWETHFDRAFELTNEKSNDFWQVQGECLAYNAPHCYYAVAQPPHNINDYVYYEGDIFDLEKQWLKECKVTIEKVPASKLHQEALIKRIIIAEDTLNDWLADDSSNLKTTLDKTIKFYENNPYKFDDYILPNGNRGKNKGLNIKNIFNKLNEKTKRKKELDSAGVKGAEAGTKMRNVLTTPKTSTIKNALKAEKILKKLNNDN